MKNSTKNAPQQKNSIQIQYSTNLRKSETASNNINNQQKKIQDNKENIIPSDNKVISQIKQLPVTNKTSIEKPKVMGQGSSNDIIQIKPSAITKEYFSDTKKVIEFCRKLGLVELKNSNEGYSKKLLEFSTQLLQKKSAELTKLNPIKQQNELNSAKALIEFLKNITSDYPDIYYGSKNNILDLLKSHNGSKEFTKEQETVSIYLPLAINTYYFRVISEQKEFKEFRELIKENDYFLEETNKEIFLLKEALTKKEEEVSLLKKEDEILKQLIKERDDIIKKKDDELGQLIKDKENEIITIIPIAIINAVP
jgi:hypothetical protein